MRPRKIKNEKGDPSSKSSTYKSNEDRDLTYFIHDRVELMHQVFSIMKTKEIRSIVPNSVRDLSLRDLEELCLEELLGISSKRLCAVLDGAEPPSDTDSSSESDHQLETISLDSISSDEANLQSSQPKKTKHKHKHHKKKRKDDSAPTEASGSAEVEAGDASRAADRAGMTVLELLELQARARAIRAQLALEQRLKGAAATVEDKQVEKNAESDSSVEIKEEKPEVVELISSEDEQKPDVQTLNASASASGLNKTVQKRADMVIIVPQNVQSKKKIKLNRTKALITSSQERKFENTAGNESISKENDSNADIEKNAEMQITKNTDQEVLETLTSINLLADDNKKKERKKKSKQRRYRKTMDDGSDQDEITLQLSDSEKMDLLEDFDRKNYDNVSSSESESGSSSDELGVEKGLENKFDKRVENAKLGKSKEKQQNVILSVASSSSPASVKTISETVSNAQNKENHFQLNIPESQASIPSNPNVPKNNEDCPDKEIGCSNKSNDFNEKNIANEANDNVTSTKHEDEPLADNKKNYDPGENNIISKENNIKSSTQDEGMLADTSVNINSHKTDSCYEANEENGNIISETTIQVKQVQAIEEPKSNIVFPISESHKNLTPEKVSDEIQPSMTEDNNKNNHATIKSSKLDSTMSAPTSNFIEIGSGKIFENLQIQIRNDNVNNQEKNSTQSEGEVTENSTSDVEVFDKPDEVVCISDEDKPEDTIKKDKKKKKKKEKKNKQEKKSKKDKGSKKERNQDFCEGSDQNYFELTKDEGTDATACICTEVSENHDVTDTSTLNQEAQVQSNSTYDSLKVLKTISKELNVRTLDGHFIDLKSSCSDDSGSENIIEIDSDNFYEVLEISDDSSCFEVEGVAVLSKEPTTDEILALAAKIDEFGYIKSKDLDRKQVIVLSPNHCRPYFELEEKIDSNIKDVTMKEPTPEELMSEPVEDLEREEVVTEDQIKRIELNENQNSVNIDYRLVNNGSNSDSSHKDKVQDTKKNEIEVNLSNDFKNLNEALAKEHEIDKKLYPDKIILSNCGETQKDLDDVLHVSWKDRYLNSQKVKTVLSTANIFNALRKKNRDLKRKIEASKAQKINEKKDTIIEPPRVQEAMVEGSIEQYKMLQGSSKYVNPVQEKKDIEVDEDGIENVIETNDHPGKSSTKVSGDADILTTDMQKDAKQIMKMYKRLLKYNSLVKPSDRNKVKKKKIKKKKKEKDNVA